MPVIWKILIRFKETGKIPSFFSLSFHFGNAQTVSNLELHVWFRAHLQPLLKPRVNRVPVQLLVIILRVTAPAFSLGGV